MKQKEITLEEKKEIQLEMLNEIDAFCRLHNIKYSLAFGTLLGAIRHKGFIPWDDDVDIMMPLPDMLKFKQLFNSDTLKYCDVDTEKHYEYDFSRIINMRTYKTVGYFVNSYGLCIDLYPVISIPKDEDNSSLFFKKANNYNRVRLFYIKWNSRLMRFCSIKRLPGFKRIIKRCRDFLLFSHEYGKSGIYYVVAGPFDLKEKMTYDIDIFKKMIDVEFEGRHYLSISCYDTFLSKRYGNYMQLPPEGERHPYHGGHYYWKRK